MIVERDPAAVGRRHATRSITPTSTAVAASPRLTTVDPLAAATTARNPAATRCTATPTATGTSIAPTAPSSPSRLRRDRRSRRASSGPIREPCDTPTSSWDAWTSPCC
jgi:hypothetical protein